MGQWLGATLPLRYNSAMLQAGEHSPIAPALSGRSVAANGKTVASNGVAGPETRTIYRFDDIEIDVSRASVMRGGQEQHLRQQSFHVLVYLIGHRQTLISKEELIENFWQGAAVTDNTIVQCIKEIRKALNDHPREPRFIKTFHKIGYRFIADVSEYQTVVSDSHAPIERNSLAIEPTPSSAFPRIYQSTLGRILIALAFLTTIIIAIWSIVRTTAAPRVAVTLPQGPGRKALAVMYFENQSGRPDLNWLSEGLADMFIADLAHFDRLSVLSREQLHLLLERTGYTPEKGVQLDQALNIARKSHADGILLGSFASLGDKLLVNVRLFDTANRLLTADEFLVDQPDDILTQVDLVTPKLASRLGIAPAGKPTTLAQVMTKNLEAYRYYSLGVSKAQAFQNAQATTLLKKAIQLDPTFAMAYARIGYAYAVTDFVPEKGKPFLEKAIQLSGQLTDKDRLYVSAWYAISRQDYPGAIKTLQQILDRYPIETEAYTRLARLQHREERVQEAIATVRRGLAVDPDYGDLYNVLGISFLALGRYDEALDAHQRYVQLAPNEPNAHDSLGMSFQQSGRFETAIAEYNQALALDPEFEPAIIHLGDVFVEQGRYSEAVGQYRRYIHVTGSDAARAVGYGSIAQVCLRRGDYAKAEEAVRHEIKYEPRAVWNSLLLALDRGQTEKASRLKATLAKLLVQSGPYPERGSRNELRSYDYYLGTLALREHQPDQALQHFERALGHLPPSSGLDLYEDCLANAYLQLGRFDEAISGYRRILSNNPNYPLAQYHMAQAYQRKGRVAEARTGYTQFLRIWKDADADIPEVVDAKQQLTRTASSK
jgi:tetratricopeptide (TPR) repeat protein